MQPNVVFIILNWNGKDFLETCLGSVFAQEYGNFEVVLADNASTDGSADRAKECFPRTDLVRLPENLGYSKGNNAGIRYALEKYQADYVLLLNNDIELKGVKWLAEMVAAAESDPLAGVLGCRLLYPDGKLQSLGRAITPYGFPPAEPPAAPDERAKPWKVDAVIGAVFLIRRALLDRIGLLDEGFSPFAAEDIDYCARAGMAGYSVKVVPGAEAIHYSSRTIKRLPSFYARVAAKKGEIRFRMLNLPVSQLLKFAVFEVYQFAAHIFERKDKTRSFSPGNIGVREAWRENAAWYYQAYIQNLRALRDILTKRFSRGKRLW